MARGSYVAHPDLNISSPPVLYLRPSPVYFMGWVIWLIDVRLLWHPVSSSGKEDTQGCHHWAFGINGGLSSQHSFTEISLQLKYWVKYRWGRYSFIWYTNVKCSPSNSWYETCEFTWPFFFFLNLCIFCWSPICYYVLFLKCSKVPRNGTKSLCRIKIIPRQLWADHNISSLHYEFFSISN